MKKQIALAFPLALLCAAAVALAAQPDSFVMYFATSSAQRVSTYCSYFDLLPVGYANFAPMVTGLLTAVMMCLHFIIWIRENGKLYKVIRDMGVVALVSSLMPLLLGNITIISWIIAGILLVVTVCAFFMSFKKEN